MRCQIALILTSALAMAAAGCATPPPVPGAPPPAPLPPPVPTAPPPNLIDFLGFTALCAKLTPVVEHKIAHLATVFPFLKPQACLVPLNDPGNFASPVPAVSAAAAVVQAEGLAEQKIAGIKALAEVGCGGYPEVEEALLASLSDPTEAVRYEAVQAIRYAAGDPCEACSGGSCCTPEILKQLDKMAYGVKDNCCPFEPSPRVRRAARLALKTCGPSLTPPIPDPVLVPEEVPPAEFLPPAEAPIPAAPAPEEVPPAPPVPLEPEVVTLADPSAVSIRSPRVVRKVEQAGLQKAQSPAIEPASHHTTQAPSPQARVRWERISIRIGDFKSYDQALDLMLALRQRTSGQSVELPPGVDPKLSFETKVFGWTRPADTQATEIADALGRLAVGKISPVLEDGGQLHLVRVLERE